jgi:hypothetical protein
MTITEGGQPRRVEVPVDMPDGVSHRGVFGEEAEKKEKTAAFYPTPGLVGPPPSSGAGRGRSGGVAAGDSAGTPGRTISPSNPPPPRTLGEQLGLSDRSKTLSKDEQKQQQLNSRLHPAIARLIERVKKNSAPAADESRFVRNGKAEVQVWLADKSKATIAALKRLGVEILLDPATSKMVVCRVAIEKLRALAELNSVRYISPVS